MAVPPLPRVRVPHPHVRCDSQVLAGSPHVAGSRVPVRRLWAWHRGGASVETLLKRYPNLGAARILDALAFAHDNLDLIEADLAREQALFEQQGGPTVGARPLSQLTLPFLDAEAPLSKAPRATATRPATARADAAADATVTPHATPSATPSATPPAAADTPSAPGAAGASPPSRGGGGQRARSGRR
ncbi:DUF433 domain-containing protein [Chondromyces crocatus]|nr:DUF433 domain-containing protein [Chondromyces crocatus]